MHVLDVASGAGHVALPAAELVGPAGSVLGIDANPSCAEANFPARKITGASSAVVLLLPGAPPIFDAHELPRSVPDGVLGRSALQSAADRVNPNLPRLELIAAAVILAVPYVVISILICWLLPAQKPDQPFAGIRQLLLRRPVTDWTWRIALVEVLFAGPDFFGVL